MRIETDFKKKSKLITDRDLCDDLVNIIMSVPIHYRPIEIVAIV